PAHQAEPTRRSARQPASLQPIQMSSCPPSRSADRRRQQWRLSARKRPLAAQAAPEPFEAVQSHSARVRMGRSGAAPSASPPLRHPPPIPAPPPPATISPATSPDISRPTLAPTLPSHSRRPALPVPLRTTDAASRTNSGSAPDPPRSSHALLPTTAPSIHLRISPARTDASPNTPPTPPLLPLSTPLPPSTHRVS